MDVKMIEPESYGFNTGIWRCRRVACFMMHGFP